MNRSTAIEILRQHAMVTRGHSEHLERLKQAIEIVTVKTAEDVGFDPPEAIQCPNCGGDLETDGKNRKETLYFVICRGPCCWTWTIEVGPADRPIIRVKPTGKTQNSSNLPV